MQIRLTGGLGPGGCCFCKVLGRGPQLSHGDEGESMLHVQTITSSEGDAWRTCSGTYASPADMVLDTYLSPTDNAIPCSQTACTGKTRSWVILIHGSSCYTSHDAAAVSCSLSSRLTVFSRFSTIDITSQNNPSHAVAAWAVGPDACA